MIGRIALLKVFVKSFFIQSAWSFEKMQGLGFAAAIAPAIRDIYKDKDHVCVALKRHMVFYNAHPYMASPILGAVIKMEEDVKAGIRGTDDISSFKESLMGPYGAIGDTFFWGSIRPLASILGVLSVLIWGLWGVGIFLVTYNIFHIWMRWSGLHKGCKLGESVVDYIKSLELIQWAARVRLFSTMLLGILLLVAIFKGIDIFMGQRLIGYQMFLASFFSAICVVLLAAIIRNRLSVLLSIYLLFLPTFIFLIIMDIILRVSKLY